MNGPEPLEPGELASVYWEARADAVAGMAKAARRRGKLSTACRHERNADQYRRNAERERAMGR
jgi:hypothetical protein